MSAQDLPLDPDALPADDVAGEAQPAGRVAPEARVDAPGAVPPSDAEVDAAEAIPVDTEAADSSAPLPGDDPALVAAAAAAARITRQPMAQFLDFERPIAELEAQITELQRVTSDSEVNLADEVQRLSEKSDDLTRSIYAKLSAWQISQVARHPLRPYTLDYIDVICSDFTELHGDRSYADDTAIVGGLARFNGEPVVVIGHQKGRSTTEKVHRRFGMPRPEGYRKAARLMRLAERFDLPVLTFIDTPGAYPGVGAEERGQSEAIAVNLQLMAGLRVPIICTVIGEGGSGGALALGVGDRLLMLEYSTYSVISPEGCASILWKSAEKAPDAAEAMGMTTERLAALELVDEVIPEPLGGAHREPRGAATAVGDAIGRALGALRGTDADDLLAVRHTRLMQYGQFK